MLCTHRVLLPLALALGLARCDCGGSPPDQDSGPGRDASPATDAAGVDRLAADVTGTDSARVDASGVDSATADRAATDAIEPDAGSADAAAPPDAWLPVDASLSVDAATPADGAAPVDATAPDAATADAGDADAGCVDCCDYDGQSRCLGNAEQVCELVQGELRWGVATVCLPGTWCSAGACTAAPEPPDPMLVAPPRPPLQPYNIYNDNSFLWLGPDPVQFGVGDGAIEEHRMAIVRGRVLDLSGTPLHGVRVSAHKAEELGFTLSRQDGRYDLVVNGGGRVTVVYQGAGLLEVQRSLDLPWHAELGLDDVRLIGLDPVVTAVDLTSAEPLQLVTSSTTSDDGGPRSARLLFASGTSGHMVLPDGSTQALPSTISVRATEYTVGEGGQQAMPAELPGGVAYTYCVELSVDEAQTAGATTVEFDRPVAVHVDNFLGFPVGGIVPVGSYDRAAAQWIAEKNGRVIGVLSEDSGLAVLDVMGSGSPATAGELSDLGITDDERRIIAEQFEPGQSLWRFAVTHFTPFDCNWNPARDMNPSDDPNDSHDDPYNPRRHPGNVCKGGGCIVHPLEQKLQERVPIAGTPYALSYVSDRVPGRRAPLVIPVFLSTLHPDLVEAEIQVTILGWTWHAFFAPQPDLTVEVPWPGLDAYGRAVADRVPAVVTKTFWYRPSFAEPASDTEYSFSSSAVVLREVVTPAGQGTVQTWRQPGLRSSFVAEIDSLSDERPLGLGGWNLDVQHRLAPMTGTLVEGHGLTRSVLPEVNKRARDADCADFVDGTSGCARFGTSVGVRPDGHAVLRAQLGSSRYVLAGLSPDGELRTIGGEGTIDSASFVQGMDVHSFKGEQQMAFFLPAPDGGYFFRTLSTVYRVDAQDRLWRPIMKDWNGHPVEDGELADGSNINIMQWTIRPSGTLIYQDGGTRKLYAIDKDGVLHHIAGNGTSTFNAGATRSKNLGLTTTPWGLAVCPDGSIITGHDTGYRLLRLKMDGSFETIAGGNGSGFTVAPTPALEARLLQTKAIACAADGTIYFTQGYGGPGIGHSISMLKNGMVSVFSGNNGTGASGEGLLAPLLTYNNPDNVAVGPDGTLFHCNGNFVRRLKTDLSAMQHVPGGPTVGSHEVMASSVDGSRFYVFDAVSGRHLRTVDTVSGQTMLSFGYDSEGRLSHVDDMDGGRTLFVRDGAGTLTAIVAPAGQRTELALDANGFLSQLTLPGNRSYLFDYDEGGLVQQATYPDGSVHGYAYDATGALIEQTLPDGRSVSYAVVEDAGEKLLTISGPGPHQTVHRIEFLPDGAKRYTSEDDGQFALSVLTRGLEEQRTEADGSRLDLVLDADPLLGAHALYPRLMTATTPAGRSMTLTTTRTASLDATTGALLSRSETYTSGSSTATAVYDAATRTLTYTTADGRVTQTVRGQDSRPERIAIDDLAPLNVTRDANGRRQSTTWGDKTWSRSYDASGLVSSISQPGGRSLNISRDVAGFVDEITDAPAGHSVGFEHDGLGRRLGITLPGDAAYQYRVDAMGRRVGFDAPLGASETRTYSDGRLASIALPSGRAITLLRDASGQLTGADSPETEQRFAGGSACCGDSAISLRSLVSGISHTLVHEMDGELLTAIESRGAAVGRVDLSYGTGTLPTGMTLTAGSDSQTWAFAYDVAMQPTGFGDWVITRAGPMGSVSSMSDATAELSLGRDQYGRLIHKSLSVAGQVRYQLDLTLDVRDRVLERVELLDGTTTTWTYSYDDLDRLLEVSRDSAVVESYAYDLRGNRLSRQLDGGSVEPSSYDLRDRIAMVGSTVYTVDVDGQLVGRGADDFVYGPRGELLQATVGSEVVDYGVDGIGRRVSRHDTRGDVEILYGVPGAWWLPLAVRLADGSMQTYTYDEAGAALALDRGATRLYVATDQVGTVRAVFDASGALLKRVDRDSFGRLLADTAPALEVVLGFGGGVDDPLTGLVRLGLRDYDPEAGRFASLDPLLFGGGQYHLYAYAGSDPVGRTDPTGMLCIGASLYSLVGGGGSLCIDGDGFSACAEVGLGLGKGISFDPFGDAKEHDEAGVKAEGSLEVLGSGVDGEFRVSSCTGITSKGKFEIPGGKSWEIENRYNPNTGRWEGGEFDDNMNNYEAAKDVVDSWKDLFQGNSPKLGYGASASVAMEGCFSF